MKKFFSLAVLTLVIIAGARLQADDSVWRTDYAQAQETAKENREYVLLNFTGSDWCRYCVFMEERVFASDEFKKYADRNLQCVYLDFPNKKELSDTLVEQNDALKEKFEVNSFPTYVLLDPSGEEVYRTSGASSWAWLFIERIDEAIHPEKYQDSPQLNWLPNEKLLADVSYLTADSDQYTLHFLDNSSYSSSPRVLKSDVFGTHKFRKYAAENLNLVLSPISTMFPPVDKMNENELEAFKNYLTAGRERAGEEPKPFEDYAPEELERYCYSAAEYKLRNDWDLARNLLPGIALQRADGNVVKVLNSGEISELIQEDGAKALIAEIQTLIKHDQAND